MDLDTDVSDRLIFYRNPATLRDASLVSLTVPLLRQKLLEEYLYDLYKMEGRNVAKPKPFAEDYISAPIPNSIKKEVSALAKKMTISLKLWKKFVSNGLPGLPTEVVWKADGMISYRLTALEFLRSNRLTLLQKFELACKHCLVDHIQSFWSDSMKEKVDNQLKTDRNNYVLRYWYSHLSGTFVDTDHVVSGVLQQLLFSRGNDDWFAVEYFLSVLSDEMKKYCESKIFCSESSLFVAEFLTSLKAERVDEVIREHKNAIFCKLAKNSEHFDLAAQVMYRMNDFDEITMKNVFSFADEHLQKIRGAERLSWLIWRLAPENLKNTVAEKWGHEIIEKSLNTSFGPTRYLFPDPYDEKNYYFNRNHALIVDILSRENREYRMQFWLKYWPALVLVEFPKVRNYVEKIMNLCFGNKNDIEDFKTTAMLDFQAIKKVCEIILEFCDGLGDLLLYFDFCSADPKLTADCRKQIVNELAHDVFTSILSWDPNDEEKWKIFQKFIDGVFSEEEMKGYCQSLMLLSDDDCGCLGRPHILIDRIKIVRKMAELCISDESIIAELKRKLRKQFCVMVIKETAESNEKRKLYEFTKWCFDDDVRKK